MSFSVEALNFFFNPSYVLLCDYFLEKSLWALHNYIVALLSRFLTEFTQTLPNLMTLYRFSLRLRALDGPFKNTNVMFPSHCFIAVDVFCISDWHKHLLLMLTPSMFLFPSAMDSTVSAWVYLYLLCRKLKCLCNLDKELNIKIIRLYGGLF